MSDLSRLRDEVKKQIKALLISSTTGLTVKELRKDFFEFMNGHLPFQKLGYISAEDMLKDMQDTVSIFWNDGEMLLKAVSDENTKHIEKLVSRQKKATKKKRRRLGEGTGRVEWNRFPLHGSPSPVVPYFIRNCVYQLLRNFRNGILLSRFDQTYFQCFGTWLEFKKLGFTSQKNLLYSIPDIVFLQLLKNGDYLIKCAETNHLQATKAPSALLPLPIENSNNNDNFSNCAHFRRKEKPNSPKCNTSAKNTDFYTYPGWKDRDTSLENKNENLQYGVDEDDVDNSSDIEINDFASSINPVLQQKIQMVLEANPNGVWARTLPLEFKKLHGNELNIKELGFLSVIEFVSNLTHVQIVRPDPKGDWLLYDANKPLPSFEKQASRTEHSLEKWSSGKSMIAATVELNWDENVTDTDKKEQVRETEVQENIRRMLKSLPSGVSLDDFMTVYKKFTSDSFAPEDVGYRSLESYLLSLASNVIHLSYSGNGCVMLTSVEKQTQKNVEEQQPKCQKQPSVSCNSFAVDAVGPGISYKLLQIPNNKQYLEVFVSNIDNPSSFWIQFRGREYSFALEKLMDELESTYYSSECSLYVMPDDFVAVGQICVTVYPEDQNWHRVSITNVPNKDFVEVYFVDYGNMCTVPRSSLRMLKCKYLGLPKQALQARLANIRPKGKKWALNSRNRMLNICLNKPLVALVTGIKDRILSLCMTDTSQRYDIHINDVLVNEGYAIFSPDTIEETDNVSENSSGLKRIPVLPFAASNVPVCTVHPNMQSSKHSDGQLSVKSEKTTKCAAACHVQRIQLTKDYTIHLINLNGTANIISAELSAFFWKMDVIRTMLRRVQLDVNKSIISKEDYPGIFKELEDYNVDGLKEGDTSKSYITLFDLNEVPLMLDVFNHSSWALKSAIQTVVDNFDPDSAYWKGSNNDAVNKQVETDIELIRLTLQALQFKRKRILKRMINDSTSHGTAVNELHEVESNMHRLGECLMRLEFHLQKKFNVETRSLKIPFDFMVQAERSVTPQQQPALKKIQPPGISMFRPGGCSPPLPDHFANYLSHQGSAASKPVILPELISLLPATVSPLPATVSPDPFQGLQQDFLTSLACLGNSQL